MLSIAKPRHRDGLDVLRARSRAAHVPSARSGEKSNLRLVTWNIRELGKREHLPESLHLIAAILGAFDLVSLIELRDDTRDLRAILSILGSDWDIVFSDYVRDAGGVYGAGTTFEWVGLVNRLAFDAALLRVAGLPSKTTASASVTDMTMVASFRRKCTKLTKC